MACAACSRSSSSTIRSSTKSASREPAHTAERLLLVKHKPVGPQRSLAELVQDDVLDRRFDDWAQHAAFPIDILGCRQLGEACSLLLGDAWPLRQ